MPAQETAPANDSRHPFARAGFAAPYDLLGAVACYHDALADSLFNDGSARKPCGLCDVCGTCFGDGAVWRDANGAEFKTGLICGEKAHRDYDSDKADELAVMRRTLRNDFAAQKRTVAREVRATERAERDARIEEDQRAAISTIDRDILAKVAHPVEWRADQGQTVADYLVWCEENGQLARGLEAATEAMNDYRVGEHTPAVEVMDITNSQHVGGFETYKRGAKAGQPKLNKKGEPKWARMRGVELRLIGKFHFETMYGWQTIAKFVTREGNVVAWKTSYAGDVSNDENKREWIKVDMTPKSQDADKYNDDRPVTWVTRVSLC